MQGNYFLIKEINHETITNCHKYVDESVNRISRGGKAVAVQVVEYKSPRSLSANNLYWMWLTEISNYLIKKGRDADKDDMHDLMRHKFLGYTEPRSVGKTIVERTLKSTSKLKKNEFCYYMEQVEAWAIEIGCNVSYPSDSEFMKYKETQIK